METEFFTARTGHRLQDTSLEARNARSIKQLNENHKRILACFNGADVTRTREDIALMLKMLIQTVTPRVRELLDANRLVVVGKRKDLTKRGSQQLLAIPESK